MNWVGARHVVPTTRGGDIKMSNGIYNQYTGYHNRRSIRLREYDYSHSGYYFVTICIDDRMKRLFGDVVDGEFVGNEFSGIVHACWNDLPNHYTHIRLDEFVIMPNHIHGIIVIRDSTNIVGAGFKPAPTTGTGRDWNRAGFNPAPTTRHGLPEIVRALKTFSSRRINQTGMLFKWQRDYYEHVVRNETSLFLIRKYVRENPVRWECDAENHIDLEIDEYGK